MAKHSSMVLERNTLHRCTWVRKWSKCKAVWLLPNGALCEDIKQMIYKLQRSNSLWYVKESHKHGRQCGTWELEAG